ncbi:MAG: hypothetical protein IJ597_01550 [Synergistaceae bacterium]|nr:hypothetical protein [Synergistaceae bacterium]
MKKFYCILIFAILSLQLSATAFAESQRRLSIVIFPTINSTELEVWESKYYPYNILEQKMSNYLEQLFKSSPMIEARTLDEAAMNRWLSGSRNRDDMAVQLELYQAIMKEKHVVGTAATGRALIRLRVYDRAKVQEIAVRNVRGKDSRFTLDSDEDIYWFDSAISGLGIPFEYGLDLFGLTNSSYKGQKMSRPTWDQFKSSSHWQAIKKAINEAYKQSMMQVRNAIDNNEPNAKLLANDNFSSEYATVGRILAPTATATRKRRDYIISLGRFANGSLDGVRIGEILDVVRSDTYVTVVPENPVVVLPKIIGKVKVIKVYDDNAVVRVVKDNRKEPITLKDIVIKRTKITGR